MKPLKIYCNREDKTYNQLLKELDKEKSILGGDIDKDGRFFLIVDVDSSKIIQQKLNSEKLK